MRHRLPKPLPSFDGLAHALLQRHQFIISEIKADHELQEITIQPGAQRYDFQSLPLHEVQNPPEIGTHRVPVNNTMLLQVRA
ncbi:hypothetical protein D8I35_03375 [Corticibacter populi]|uniref:Uncharacterized protein n=1 Tax=Corticibacter populi TaxID=1550736 RepID=A0A3M6QZX6_9BURK|nr:hypothetical protein D8I35_03375 [Corticibacter populi]RZS35433.1 hypothetical protein EV687_0499 [Corticibacter populi]